MGKEMSLSQLAALMQTAAMKVDPTASAKMRTIAQMGVGIMKSEIQAVHAVDTGAMVNSVGAESVGKNTVMIGPTVQYAPYVALGTRFVAARPFHIAASRKLQSQVKDIFSAEDLGI